MTEPAIRSAQIVRTSEQPRFTRSDVVQFASSIFVAFIVGVIVGRLGL